MKNSLLLLLLTIVLLTGCVTSNTTATVEVATKVSDNKRECKNKIEYRTKTIRVEVKQKLNMPKLMPIREFMKLSDTDKAKYFASKYAEMLKNLPRI